MRRFNSLLVRSVMTAWRRYGTGAWPAPELAQDLLQNVYLKIVERNYHLLSSFRGTTEAEAEAYLAHAAINVTISTIRKQLAQRRSAPEISLDEWLQHETAPSVLAQRVSLSEGELLGLLKKCFTGANSRRDITIFLLYACNGCSVAEIASLGIADLKETSIANLLGQMKTRLRNFLTNPV